MRNGRAVQSRLYSGRYSLGKGRRPVTVALHVTDRKAAVAKLRALVVEKEREQAGILAPAGVREAASAPLVELVTRYETDLRSRTKSGHSRESVARIRRAVASCGWSRLADVTPASWVAYRASLARSAKTVKEYQTSVMAWLNWLVRMDMLPANPLARVGSVKTLGKSVRPSRAFSQAEFSELLSVAPAHRRLVYLFLAYTGLRKSEARGLRWSAVDLQRGLATVRGKGDKTRVVPLRAELVDALGEVRPVVWSGPSGRNSPMDAPVFPVWPSHDVLRADFKRAGIERVNGSGQVLHWHAFRKTFVTWAAVSGVGQRSTQTVVGHSTPVLTANVYTDVEALPLRDEVAKLPWLGSGAVENAQNAPKTAHFDRFQSLLGELVELAQVVSVQQKTDPFESVKSGCPTWIRTMTR